MEKEMAARSSVLAWRKPRDGGAWWAAIYGVAHSRTLSDLAAAAAATGQLNQDCHSGYRIPPSYVALPAIPYDIYFHHSQS